MWPSDSSRYLARPDWAAALSTRALSAQNEANLSSYLEAFRQRDNFYSDRLNGISDWLDIPPLEKRELAAVPVTTLEPLHETRSSGTTGAQAIVINTAIERRFRQALAYRPFLFYPITSAGDNVVRQVIFVDGVDLETANKQQWPFEFGGYTYLTWRIGIAAAPDRIHELLKEVRPHVLRGLTSGIVRFAEELQRPLEELGVQVISPSGEQLSSDWRASLENTFGAPVLDRYGATETGSIAWQCPYCKHYHVNSDEVVVEASDDGVLATPLFIESQALLRYRLDDRIQLHEASNNCRVRLPTLSLLEARRDDWIIDNKGLKVSPLSFQFEQIPALKAWRLHQLNTGLICLYFDNETPAGDLQQQLFKHLQHILPDHDYELVEGVWKFDRGGKFKRVTSDMAQ